MRRVIVVAAGVLAVLLVAGQLRASSDVDPVNMIPAYGRPPTATQPPSGAALASIESSIRAPKGPAVKAGVAVVDATWHVGASAGQYATDRVDPENPNAEAIVGEHNVDPNMLSVHRVPSYGIQSRDDVRALVVEGLDGTRMALVKDDLYIPQDLLNQRVSTILKDRDQQIKLGLLPGTPTGISDENMMVAVTHSHSSPYYSSPSWGVWVFQDVFDLRFFEFMAQRLADAVVQASDHIVPVRMGAETLPFDFTQRHSFGPAVGDRSEERRVG